MARILRNTTSAESLKGSVGQVTKKKNGGHWLLDRIKKNPLGSKSIKEKLTGRIKSDTRSFSRETASTIHTIFSRSRPS